LKYSHNLDEISGGRSILGIGAGLHKPEYDALGYLFDHRASSFEEELQIIVSGTATLIGEKGGRAKKYRRSLASCVYAKQHSRANGRVETILPE
jgi:alkanesulfonate monooxygenase SsuD/methylene tetrahydromethanopterin reductase-like flavin-dependent oxidoreductase (luciferase family)